MAERTLSSWLKEIERLHPSEIELGLERVMAVWERMGSPSIGALVATVAGTNGKGSTVANLEALALATGKTVATYTSPHIRFFNERIRINGFPASDRSLCKAFAAVDSARRQLPEISLTYFEAATLAAFYRFSKAQPELAILEVGLGGRLDAVNIIDTDVAVLTSIGIDHQAWLGDDRETIAIEKAGILRTNGMAVCGDRQPPDSLLNRVDELGVDMKWLGVDFDWQQTTDEIQFVSESMSITIPQPALTGLHQRDNQVVALEVFRLLYPASFPPLDVLEDAQSRIDLEGRFQHVHNAPDIWVDVAHNSDAAMALLECIQALPMPDQPGIRIGVLGMLADKNPEDVVTLLEPVIDEWVLTGTGGSRGQSAHKLQERLLAAGLAMTVREPQGLFETVGEALDSLALARHQHDQIIVFGSFLIVEQALIRLSR